MNTLSQTYAVKSVFLNRDYEPYARERDEDVFKYWNEHDVTVVGAKDHVIFSMNEVGAKRDGTPYLVFSPYGGAWRKTD